MVTDSEYNQIANSVYNVEPSKARENGEEVVKQGSVINNDVTGQSYQVLQVEDNTANGMQAMAVAPVDENGYSSPLR